MVMEKEKPICEKCKSNERVVKFGKIPTVKRGFKQRYRCQLCGNTMYDGDNSEKCE